MILGHNPIAWALAVTQLTAAPAGVPRNPERPMKSFVMQGSAGPC